MNNLKTGTIVLFSGRCKVSKLIRLLSLSKWSHVGIVINDDPNHNLPLLYESTHNNTIKGLDLNAHTEGVQCVPLQERIDTYNGRVAIRRVISPCYKQRHKLRLYRTRMIGTPFEKSKLELLACLPMFSWLRGEEDLSSIFCSEHVAEALMSLGWLKKDKPSNHFSPKYFVNQTEYLNGVSYGPIELIK